MPLVHDLLIMRQISNFRMDRCTHKEKSLADSDDGEELIDTKLGGSHSTDKRLQPSQLCMIWALAC